MASIGNVIEAAINVKAAAWRGAKNAASWRESGCGNGSESASRKESSGEKKKPISILWLIEKANVIVAEETIVIAIEPADIQKLTSS